MPLFLGFDQWIATRPRKVQQLAREFAQGTFLRTPAWASGYVLGYQDGDTLIMSEYDPAVSLRIAMAFRFVVNAAHVREDREGGGHV